MNGKPIPLREWLHHELGARRLARLTEQDHTALDAAVAMLRLYTHFPEPSIIQSFAVAVWRMQPDCREVAYHTIARVLDWPDRSRLWDMTYLPPVKRPWVCRNEPQPFARR